MHDPRPDDLDARLSRLEAGFEELRHAVRRIEAAVAAPPAPPPVVEPAAPLPATVGEPAAITEEAGARERSLPWLSSVEPVLNGEFWLSKVGIGLLLLGVAFLFKYSIEQGWITPAVRIAFGGAVGTVLTAWGLRIRDTQRSLSLILLGGGIGVFYMVGFAASQLYGLLPTPGALAYMAAVTAGAFLLSLREDEPLLAIVGTLGGVGTPFLLFPRTGSIAWLSAYVGSIALWNGIVYARRRWDPALAAAAAGCWVALVSGLVVSERAGPVEGMGRWALQGSVALVWLVLGVLPVALLLLRSRAGAPGDAAGEDDDGQEMVYPAIIAFASPLVAVLFTSALWEMSERQWGTGTAVVGALYLAAALWARPRHAEWAAVLGVTAAVLLTLGTAFAAEGETRTVLLAAEAAGLHLQARRGLGKGVAALAHLVFAGLAGAFLVRLGDLTPLDAVFGEGEGGGALPGTRSLADLAVIAAAGVAALGARDGMGRIYRGAAALAFLLWGWRALAGFPEGVAYASVAWALGGVALLALARRGDADELGPVAHLSFAVLAMLLLRHLAEADPLALLGEGGGASLLPVLNPRGLADLAIVAAAFGASFLLPRREALVYRLAAHAAVLQWIWREFSALPGGEGIVSALWGVYGVALLVVATLRGYAMLQTVAKLTLLLLVAKMFLVDLRALEALWRVLLFSGLGGLFLLLSYYVGRRKQLPVAPGAAPEPERPTPTPR